METENKKPSNPPAFPCGNDSHVLQGGMTLRDYFANSAMQGILISRNYDNCTGNNGLPVNDFVVKEAYELADAMIKQREL